MTTLDILPEELIILISDFILSPLDISNFMNTNRFIYNSAMKSDSWKYNANKLYYCLNYNNLGLIEGWRHQRNRFKRIDNIRKMKNNIQNYDKYIREWYNDYMMYYNKEISNLRNIMYKEKYFDRMNILDRYKELYDKMIMLPDKFYKINEKKYSQIISYELSDRFYKFYIDLNKALNNFRKKKTLIYVDLKSKLEYGNKIYSYPSCRSVENGYIYPSESSDPEFRIIFEEINIRFNEYQKT